MSQRTLVLFSEQVTYYKFYSFLCIDINECNEEIDDCAQNCTNTNGSYTCSCNTGYRLGSDGHSCFGTKINNNYSSDLSVRWTRKSQISMSVKRKFISVLKGAPILLVPTCVSVMLAIHRAWMKPPVLVRSLRVCSLLIKYCILFL